MNFNGYSLKFIFHEKFIMNPKLTYNHNTNLTINNNDNDGNSSLKLETK